MGLSYFKKGYQPRTYRVMNDKGDLVADSCNIVARCRNCFSQLLIYMGLGGQKHTA